MSLLSLDVLSSVLIFGQIPQENHHLTRLALSRKSKTNYVRRLFIEWKRDNDQTREATGELSTYAGIYVVDPWPGQHALTQSNYSRPPSLFRVLVRCFFSSAVSFEGSSYGCFLIIQEFFYNICAGVQ